MTPYERERNLTGALCRLHSMEWIKTRSVLDAVVKIRWAVSIICFLASIIWTSIADTETVTKLLTAGLAVSLPQILGALFNIGFMGNYPMPSEEEIKHRATEILERLEDQEPDVIKIFDKCITEIIEMKDADARETAAELEGYPTFQDSKLIALMRDVL